MIERLRITILDQIFDAPFAQASDAAFRGTPPIPDVPRDITPLRFDTSDLPYLYGAIVQCIGRTQSRVRRGLWAAKT